MPIAYAYQRWALVWLACIHTLDSMETQSKDAINHPHECTTSDKLEIAQALMNRCPKHLQIDTAPPLAVVPSCTVV